MTEIIYIGRRKLSTGNPGNCFITVDLFTSLQNRGLTAWDTIDQWSSAFKTSKHFKPAIVGGIYETDADLSISDDGKIHSIAYGRLKFVSMSRSEHLANWRMEDNAIDEEKRRAFAINRAKENTELDLAVKTLNKHYKNISYAHRQSFKLWLLDELEKK